MTDSKSIFVFMTLLSIGFFASCTEKTPPAEKAVVLPLNAADSAFYLERGSDLMGEAKRVISSTLVDAMEEGGVRYAAQFCNVRAYPLLDSISKTQHALIRRVSDKPRNPKDTMDQIETAAFSLFQSQHSKGAEASGGIIVDEMNYVRYLAPITLSMESCLKCHGTVGKDISQEDYAYLNSIYPDDTAINYKKGDLRGMFSIRLEKAH